MYACVCRRYVRVYACSLVIGMRAPAAYATSFFCSRLKHSRGDARKNPISNKLFSTSIRRNHPLLCTHISHAPQEP